MSEDEETDFEESEEEAEEPKQKKRKTPLDDNIDEMLGEDVIDFFSN